jgi:2,4-didehydro-3-deoxy-L-rhamnonate hydrolase
MRQWRIGTGLIGGRPQVVIAHDAGYTRLGAILGPDAPDDTRSFIDRGAGLALRVQAAVDEGVPADLDVVPQWAPPVMPGKLICIGANYAEHNAEMLGEVRNDVPYAFLKPPTTALIGSGQDAPLPGHASEIDYEAELSIVIGRRARALSRNDALAAVFGYAVLNDLSARDWVRKPTALGLDWVMLKSFDASAPMGPLITPAAFAGDPDDLTIRLWVNDQLRQDSRTSRMLFDVRAIIAHLSAVMTLEPGDVIATGTPSGVGMSARPPAWLRAGDVVRVEIENLGTLVTPIAPQLAEMTERKTNDHR